MDGRHWLNAADAARYLSLRTEVFRRRVRAGTLPPGSSALGSRATRWSTNELDRLMRGGDSKAGKSIGELIQTYIVSSVSLFDGPLITDFDGLPTSASRLL